MKGVIAVFLLFTIHISLLAQTARYTVCAEEISKCLKNYGIDIKEAGIFSMDGLLTGKTLEVKKIDNIISSIGINLFPSGLKRPNSVLLLDFVERYWLELLLCKDGLAVSKKLKEDNIDLIIDSLYYDVSFPSVKSILNTIQTDRISYTQTDSIYKFGWEALEGKGVKLQFRKRIGQILGMDKRELEAYFLYKLENYSIKKRKELTVSPGELSQSVIPDVFIEKNDIYLIPEMKSDKYWKKENDFYTLLFDKDYAPESVMNLFQGGQDMDSIYLSINQRYYTSKNKIYEYPLSKWVSFMEEESNKTYVGIDEVEKDEVKGVVIYVNNDYQYNHALYFKCPKSVLDNRVGSIDVTVYTYIPTHNIETLYGKDNVKEVRRLIKIIQL